MSLLVTLIPGDLHIGGQVHFDRHAGHGACPAGAEELIRIPPQRITSEGSLAKGQENPEPRTLQRKSQKSAGADTGPHGAAAAGGGGGAGVEAAPGDGAGGLSRASEQGSQEVAHQEMAGQTPGRQIPAAVEVALEQKT